MHAHPGSSTPSSLLARHRQVQPQACSAIPCSQARGLAAASGDPAAAHGVRPRPGARGRPPFRPAGPGAPRRRLPPDGCGARAGASLGHGPVPRWQPADQRAARPAAHRAQRRARSHADPRCAGGAGRRSERPARCEPCIRASARTASSISPRGREPPGRTTPGWPARGTRRRTHPPAGPEPRQRPRHVGFPGEPGASQHPGAGPW